jgi:hypothetical protein
LDAVVIEDYVDHLVSFRSLGGTVHRLSGPSLLRNLWTADALAHLNGLYDDIASGDPRRQVTDRQLAGASFMHWALEESPECFVAVRDASVVAAMGFAIKHDSIAGTKLGSRQGTRGAAFAVAFALVREAHRLDRPVIGVYTGHEAREFHARLGRTLDARHGGSSEWSVLDCRDILDGVTGRM